MHTIMHTIMYKGQAIFWAENEQATKDIVLKLIERLAMKDPDQGKFNFKAVCRAKKNDPETSHEMARKMSGSSLAQDQMWWGLRMVTYCPGLTALELRAEMKKRHLEVFNSWGKQLNGNAIGKGLSMLKKEGFVIQGEKRLCSVCKNKCVTWYVNERQRLVSSWVAPNRPFGGSFTEIIVAILAGRSAETKELLKMVIDTKLAPSLQNTVELVRLDIVVSK